MKSENFEMEGRHLKTQPNSSLVKLLVFELLMRSE